MEKVPRWWQPAERGYLSSPSHCGVPASGPAHLAAPLSQSLVKWESENKMVCEQRLLKGEGPKTSWTRELTNDGELILVSPASPCQRGGPVAFREFLGHSRCRGSRKVGWSPDRAVPVPCSTLVQRIMVSLLCGAADMHGEAPAGDLPGWGRRTWHGPLGLCCHPPSRCARAFRDQVLPVGPEPRSRVGLGDRAESLRSALVPSSMGPWDLRANSSVLPDHDSG